MSRDCEHGQLARSCNICDLERELKAVTAQRDKLLAALKKKCVPPLELYNAYGRPDRAGVIQKVKAVITKVKEQS